MIAVTIALSAVLMLGALLQFSEWDKKRGYAKTASRRGWVEDAAVYSMDARSARKNALIMGALSILAFLVPLVLPLLVAGIAPVLLGGGQ